MDSATDQRLRATTSWLSIFTSASTLVCCALPALLVTLGAGATLASLVGMFPQLVWLSENKAIVFGVAGLMLAIAGYFQWRARFAPCPALPTRRLPRPARDSDGGRKRSMLPPSRST